jgi:acyl dehydratase
MVDEALEEQLASLVGAPVGRNGPSVAPDPVNLPMIRHWTAAFGDDNPVYTDPEAAAGSRFGQLVAPPLMLQTWTMPTPMLVGIAERGGSPVAVDGETALAVLDRAGYVGTLATNSEFEILRYLHLGEVVSATTLFESISEEKSTRMGRGRFVTWVTTYAVGSGEVVGRQTFRILKFDPSGSEA